MTVLGSEVQSGEPPVAARQRRTGLRSRRVAGALLRAAVAWAVLAVGVVVAGYVLVGSADAGPAKSFDGPIGRYVVRHRAGFFVPVAEQAWLLLVPFVVVLIVRCWRARDRLTAVAAGGVLVSAVAGAAALVWLAQVVAARPRPPRVLAASGERGFSYPSTFAAVTTAACVVMTALEAPEGTRWRTRRDRRRYWAACWMACVALGASRLVVGVAWTTDVVVGVAIGAAWAAVCLRTRRSVASGLAAARHGGVAAPPRRRARWGIAVTALLFAVAIAPPVRSYVRALTFPGSASWQVRSVDWLRAEGAAPVVDWVEGYWYSRTPPRSTDKAPRLRDPFGAWPGRVAGARGWPGSPAPIRSPFARRLRHEASWLPGPRRVHGGSALYTAEWRPDRAHPGLLVAAVWFDHRLVEPRLVPGTREPGGRGWAWRSQIPRAWRSLVVAAFNGGFLPLDHVGGYETEHRIPVRLQLGAASLVVWRDGRADVRAWTPRLTRDAAVVSVRQNLALIVEHGRPEPRLLGRVGRRWGGLFNQREYTWRSGLGVDRRGNLIYVAGNHLTIQTVAVALSEAGAVRGMELDIHPGVVTANLYVPDARRATGVDGYKLLASMPRPATRYLKPDQRDFVAMVLRTGQADKA
jgi:membrane-associated phospholipid phosphatase